MTFTGSVGDKGVVRNGEGASSMTTATRSTNEAADRLREVATNGQSVNHSEYLRRNALINEALATERRLTVERAAFIVADHGFGHAMPMDHNDWRDGESAFDHIRRHLLDEVEQREPPGEPR